MKRTIDYKEHLLESLKDPKERAAYLRAALEEDSESFFFSA